MSLFEKRQGVDMTIREMGLQDSLNTRIGGSGAKGISVGQKRRVGICIKILTRPKLLFLHKPISGLDSAASYYVMSRIARADTCEGRTIITSIHRPSSGVFRLFDNLCLLSSGRIIYFGPANEFFALNGFPCPSLQNPSDHFLKTINKDFHEDIEQGSSEMPTTDVTEMLTSSHKLSNNYQESVIQVAEICKQNKQKGEQVEQRRTHANFITQCLVLTRRSFVNMYLDLGYYWFRLAIYLTVGLGLGTIFLNSGSSYCSVQVRNKPKLWHRYITFP